MNRVVAGSNPVLHPNYGGGSSVGRARTCLYAPRRPLFMLADPEVVEGPGCDPGARRFESARSTQSACRPMVKTLV